MATDRKPLMRVKDWRVERSGPGLRVIGTDAEGRAVKLTGVTAIVRADGVTVACMRDAHANGVILV